VALIDSAGDDRAPAWSPDGRRLAFESDRDGNWDVFVSDASGANQRPITRDRASDRHAAWGPRADQLALVRSRDGRSELIVVRLTDSAERVVAATGTSNFLFPSWSPDGERIAFTREQAGTFGLEWVPAEGGTPRPLIVSGASRRDLWPRWSLDGKRFAFFSRRVPHLEDDEVYVSELDGRLTRVTARAGHDFTPAWSPDGRRLAVATVGAPGGPALAIIRLNGAVDETLASGFAAVTEPSWHPEGRRIAYAARGEAKYAIYVESIVE
jgi:TolB protein